MKIRITIYLLFLNFIAVYGQQKFNLEQAIAYAEQNHSIYKSNQLDVQDAQAQINEYKAIGLPKLSAGVDYQYFFIRPDQVVEDFVSPAVFGVLFGEGILEPRELGDPQVFEFSFNRRNNLNGFVSFSTLLFDANYLNGLKAAKLFKELTATTTKLSERDLKADITKAFIAVLIAEKNVEIVQNNINNVEKILLETQQIYENGFVEQLDVDRINLTLENLKIEREKVDQIIELSKNGLKFQMAYPLDEEINVLGELEEALALITLDASENMDITKRPEYEVFNQAIALDKMDEHRLEKAWLPSLNLSARVQESLQRDDLFDGTEAGLLPSGNVALGLKFSIFDGNLRKSQLQRTRIRLQKNEIDFDEFQRGMQIQVQNAKIGFDNAVNTMQNLKRALELNQKIYDTTLIKYKEGVGSSIEVNLAESAYFKAQADYINAIYDVILNKVELDVAHGNIK